MYWTILLLFDDDGCFLGGQYPVGAGIGTQLDYSSELPSDIFQWVRPPTIVIGQVQPVPQGGSIVRILECLVTKLKLCRQITTNSDENGLSLSIHLALNITYATSYFD